MTGIQKKTVEHVAILRAMAGNGKTRAQAAEVIGLSVAQVGLIARKHSIKFEHAARINKAPPDARAYRMAAMYRGGSTLEQIGQIYRITRERVRQILTKHFEFNRVDGGQYKQVNDRRARADARRDARYLQKTGCTFAEWKAICDVGAAMRQSGIGAYRCPGRAYSGQKANAARRGIGWDLTLAEWWRIWTESGKWEERGRGSGYVMCRHGDVGPYAVGNVFIARGFENSSERRDKKSNLPTGVTSRNGSRFYAKRMIDGTLLNLGGYPSAEAAYSAYLAAGEQRAAS